MPLNLEPSLLEALKGIENLRVQREVFMHLQNFWEVLERQDTPDKVAFFLGQRLMIVSDLAQELTGSLEGQDYENVVTAITTIANRRYRELLGMTGEDTK